MDIYLVNALELETYAPRLVPLLTRWRRHQLDNAPTVYARRGSLACSMMLRHVLGWTDDEGLSISKTGKPIPGEGKHFNMAYAKDLAVLAVDDDPVGVDIEPIFPFKDITLRHIGRLEEADWVHEAEPELRFFTLWTRKESITKADGRGHLLAPKTFTIVPLEEQPHDIFGDKWYTETVVWDDYVISAASPHPIDRLNIIHLKPEDLVPPQEEDNGGEWNGEQEFYYGD